jgi:hypothetical protein
MFHLSPRDHKRGFSNGAWNELTNCLRGAEPYLRSHQSLCYSQISQHFMEPESSLPCSQEPSTGPRPEPDESSAYHCNWSLLIPS